MTQINDSNTQLNNFYSTSLVVEILNRKGIELTHRQKLIEQIKLFDKDWYEDYYNITTEIMTFPSLTRFGDLEEKNDRTDFLVGLDYRNDPLDNESILSALILIG